MPQYQGVWTLEAQAQAQSNQQWVTDPNFKNTTLLLQADGTGSGSQNNTFLDGSTNNFFITRNGNTTQGSFSPFSQAPGYWSNYFTTSDGLSIGTAVTVGNTWTVECWFVVLQTGQTILVNGNGATGDPWIGLSGGTVQISFSSVTRSFTAPYSLGVWYHLALTCNAGTVTVYLNGVQQGATQSSPTSNLTINRIAGYNGGGANAWFGYISNLRITNTVVYSSNFTPQTTPLTAISGTALLTCQSNRFVDNSATAAAITINAGTPSVQAYSPFAPALQWTPDVVGGSAYYDGSGDVLTVPSNSAFDFAGDVTIEFWIYFTGNMGVRQDLIHHASNGFEILKLSGDTIYCGFGGGTITSSITVKAGQWYHIALVRSSTGSNGLNLYINGVNVGSSTAASSVTSGTMAIGAQASGNQPTSGYFSSLRIVKGTAVYTTTFTPPTAPVTAITNTSLLLNYTNAGIYDGKMGNVLETVGNAQVSTNPVKFGSGSMYFPPTNGNYCVSPPNQPNFIYGTGNFTVEAWLYPIAFTNVASGAFGYGLSGGAVDWGFEIDTSGNALWVDTNGVRFYASVRLRAGVWTHVAVVRTNTGTTMYYNGVNVGTYSTINNISGTSGARLYVGTGAQVPGSRQFVGFIDDFRVTKDARYFTNFTPPQQALPRQ